MSTITVTVDRMAAQRLVNAWSTGQDNRTIIAGIRDLFAGQDGELPVLERALEDQA